ncbi:MAG: ABC transporter ATP-binding protein [Myxococcales bacterium]|nr:ABC transporter ATP-binding protein [Myxococcales bacterium]MDH5307569.1 ABC transporter ATP-binding protein [Myxococcales bacterium]MDH5565511.1 ABC transporter ATP-binding protein [Myxococcales bacterium]
MPDTLLRVEELRVDYEEVTAVRDVSFDVEAGMVYGLIGPNGAGKTSIMNAIATLVEPTYGRVSVCGMSVSEDPVHALPRLGFMPDFPPLYEDLTVLEFLELFASAYGIPHEARGTRIDVLLEQMRLGEKRDAMTGSLSRGMRQRLFLAKTLLHDPDVLLLDEPASGLDPNARSELAAIIRGLGQANKAVLVSSHILAEMEDFCNSVGIVEEGRMLVSGRIHEVVSRLRAGRSTKLSLAVPDERLAAFLAARPDVTQLVADASHAAFELAGDVAEAAALLHALVDAGFAVADFAEEAAGIQDIFERLSAGKTS